MSYLTPFLYLALAAVAVLLYAAFVLGKLQLKISSMPFKGTHVLFFLLNRTQFPEKLREYSLKHHPEDFVSLCLVNRVALLSISPKAAKFILTSKDGISKQFSVGAYSVRNLFTQNLVSTDGADWRRQRVLYASAFIQESFNSYYPKFISTTEKALSVFYKQSQSGDVEVKNILSKFTLDVLGLSIFDVDYKTLDGELSDYYEAYKGVLAGAFAPAFMLAPWLEYLPFGKGAKTRRNVKKLMELFDTMIKERRENFEDKNDVLTHFIQATEQKDQALTQEELISNVFILFVAGHETTATSLTWLMYVLSSYPEIQQKIRDEVVAKVGDKVPTMQDLEQCEYLGCVISESLRMYPPVTTIFTRQATQDIDFEGKKIEKGTFLGLGIYAIHHDEKYWDKPMEFIPERFLPENKKKLDRFAYLPFSLGPRQCIGNHFSLIEQHLFISRLLQSYEILPPKDKVNTMKRTTGLYVPDQFFVSLRPIVKQ